MDVSSTLANMDISSTASPPCITPPKLLPEIWAKVIECLPTESDEDCGHLWTKYRHVSRIFMYEIERLFAKHLLRRFFLYYDLDLSEHKRTILYSFPTFEFSRMSEDLQRAIFKYPGGPLPAYSTPGWLFRTHKFLEVCSYRVSKSTGREVEYYTEYLGSTASAKSKEYESRMIKHRRERHQDPWNREEMVFDLNETTMEITFPWKPMVTAWYFPRNFSFRAPKEAFEREKEGPPGMSILGPHWDHEGWKKPKKACFTQSPGTHQWD